MQASAIVLIIEDADDTREALSSFIERGGYVAEVASDGLEALHKLQSGLEPAIIVLDLGLDAFSGFAFREAQLKDPQFAQIPIIVQSGVYDIKAAAQQLGAVAYFQKPLDIDKMLCALQQHP